MTQEKSTATTQQRKADLMEKIRFLFVGCLNTAVDFSIFNLLTLLTHTPLIIANIFSTFSAMCVSLVLNKYLVFQNKKPMTSKTLLMFLLVTLSSTWLLQSLIIFILTKQFPVPLMTLSHELVQTHITGKIGEGFITANLAKIIATGASLVWNYYFYKKFVFKNND
jgi:putative flippase GtrA